MSSYPEACSAVSLAAGEPLAGSASTATGYLLLEHGGPWGAKILRDAVFPGPDGSPSDLGARLQEVFAPLGVTPLLVRRPGGRRGVPSPATVALVALDAAGGRGAVTSVTHLTEVTSWDLPGLLAELRDGSVPPGWEAMATQYLVCTHARRDPCCGRLGRPLVAALSALDPDRTWEASHLGGHRLAANTLVLPEGVVYGRLAAEDAGRLTAAHDAGRLLVGSLRGRPALPHPVQAAEIALRERTGEDVAGVVRLLDASQAPEAPSTWVTSWSAADRAWRVVVDVVPGESGPRPASCGGEPAAPPLRHVVRAVDPAG